MNEGKALVELSKDLQDEFDRDLEIEFGPLADDTSAITMEQFNEESARMQKFVQMWRRVHGL